jgi:hypothetical protein
VDGQVLWRWLGAPYTMASQGDPDMSAPGPSDSSAVLLVLTSFGVLLGGLGLRRWRQLAAMREGMTLAGATDARITGLQGAAGTVNGRLVRYVTVNGNSSSKGYTRASTQLPPDAAQLELHLKPESPRDKVLVQRGDEVDVVVGVPHFDAAFVVEAAPAETVRALLDAHTRSDLLTLSPCELHVARGQVQFRKSGMWIAPWEVCEIARLVSGVAARMPALALEQQEQQLHALHAPTDGYRGITAGESMSRLAESEVAREIAHLRGVRRRRAQERAILVAILGVLALVAFFVISGLLAR